MAVYIVTENPSALLKKFKDKIAATGKDSINTWVSKNSGFEHTSQQLAGKALLKVEETEYEGEKALRFLAKKVGEPENWAEYIYPELHGNIAATFIKHFRGEFKHAVAVDERT